MSRYQAAWRDLQDALCKQRVWLHLSGVEVKQKYRRSLLGPWWVSLHMALFILVMAVVFGRLFHENLSQYLPFFASGFILWTLLSNSVVEATEVFKNSSSFIKQVPLPYNLYLLKHLSKHAIYFFHHSAIYVLVCLFFSFNPGMQLLWFVPGFFLFLANLYWVCLLTAIVATRFRDLIPIVSSGMQIAFFTTPVSWMPRLLGEHSRILALNPLVYLLDIVRSPLLGQAPEGKSWAVCVGMLICGFLATLLCFARARPRLAFWVD